MDTDWTESIREIGSTRAVVWAGPRKGEGAWLTKIYERAGRSVCVLKLDDGTVIEIERAENMRSQPIVREVGS